MTRQELDERITELEQMMREGDYEGVAAVAKAAGMRVRPMREDNETPIMRKLREAGADDPQVARLHANMLRMGESQRRLIERVLIEGDAELPRQLSVLREAGAMNDGTIEGMLALSPAQRRAGMVGFANDEVQQRAPAGMPMKESRDYETSMATLEVVLAAERNAMREAQAAVGDDEDRACPTCEGEGCASCEGTGRVEALGEQDRPLDDPDRTNFDDLSDDDEDESASSLNSGTKQRRPPSSAHEHNAGYATPNRRRHSASSLSDTDGADTLNEAEAAWMAQLGYAPPPDETDAMRFLRESGIPLKDPR